MADVAIVGAGLAGLCCAARLEQAGISVILLEAADAPGGRIRTDFIDGFRLDRGFQVLFTGYPELAQQIDTRALRLRTFARGALVWHGSRFHHFADPFRGSLGNAIGIITDPVVTLGDKLRIARLRRQVGRGAPADLFRPPELPTRQFLEKYGFSPKITDRFFLPLISAFFLEQELVTSSRYFQFLFRMLAFSDAAIPENGMESLPRQLAVRLRKGSIHTGVRVTALRREGRGFVLEAANGSRYPAVQVVLAVDAEQAARLLGKRRFANSPVQWNRGTTFYYAAHRAPIAGPMIALNGEGSAAGPVNSAVVISQASERYAPPGAHLIAANIVGRAPQSALQIEQLERETHAHLRLWFGADVTGWTVCAGYPIVHAVPLCTRAEWQRGNSREAEGVYVCGDDRDLPSIQGALAAGRRAAELVLRHCS
ncbi:MAG TPA: NAD(P)/FAD-dependent oxidoreductase [Acidobacteriaceae bacterium]